MKRLQFLVLIFFAATVVVFAQEKAEKLGPKTVKQAVIDKADSPTASIKKSNGIATVASYDFTTGSGQYHGGTAAAVEVEPGVWAMIAGDTNGSGIITNSDKDAVINDLNQAGYYAGDTNFSGIVTNSDKDFIIDNLNKASQVP